MMCLWYNALMGYKTGYHPHGNKNHGHCYAQFTINDKYEGLQTRSLGFLQNRGTLEEDSPQVFSKRDLFDR